MGEAEKVQVALRIRDHDNFTEKDNCFVLGRKGHSVQKSAQNSRIVTIHDPTDDDKALREFMFDKVYPRKTNQEVIFHEVCKPYIAKILEGYNACLFAYGQTGSGKTHSIFGKDGHATGHMRGVLPRAVEELYDRIDSESSTHTFNVFVSFLEIYLDEIGDLGRCYLDKKKGIKTKLVTPSGETGSRYPYKSLKIRETQDGQVKVENLSQIPIKSKEELMEVVNCGVKNRATFETMLNEYSSRSHTVFTIQVFRKAKNPLDPGTAITQGSLNLIDLAGSERLKKSQSEHQRMKEAVSINSSLSALGNVILGLHNSSSHVPYRDSKLTRILQTYLGGNAYTTLLATLDPRVANYDENLATLQFAFRCKNVRNQPTITYVDTTSAAKDKRIKQLEAEVARLKKELFECRRAIKSGDFGDLLEGGGADGKHMSARKRALLKQMGDIDGLSQLPSDANTSEIEMMKNEKRYAKLVKEKMATSAKIKASKEEAMKLKKDAMESEKKFKSQVLDAKKKQNEAVKQAQQMKRQTQMELEKTREDHSKTIAEMKQSYEEQIGALENLIRQYPEVYKNASKTLSKKISDADTVKSKMSALERQKLAKLASQKDASFNEMQSAKDSIIFKKNKELKVLEEELEKSKDDHLSEVQSLKHQIDLLYEYNTKTNTVLHRLETGQYPVQFKFGVKTIRIPEDEQPAPVKEELVPYLKGKICAVNEFIHEAELYTDNKSISAKSGELFTPKTPSSTSSPRYNHVPFSPSLRRKTPTARFSTLNYNFPTTPNKTMRSTTSQSSRRPQSAATSFRRHLATQRQKTRAKSSPSSGDSLDLTESFDYREQYMKEQQKNKNLTISMNSLKREVDRLRNENSKMQQIKTKRVQSAKRRTLNKSGLLSPTLSRANSQL